MLLKKLTDDEKDYLEIEVNKDEFIMILSALHHEADRLMEKRTLLSRESKYFNYLDLHYRLKVRFFHK